ncbi:outer membrane protein assembly factor BamB family protein [Erythrobacter sp. Alg231-14]|uniref:outer membrane protein assembly factor BamB family protein n=1 Tax=Erythrobacter sp. Alg231-14 TaxID=1922225 RepID=UPI000D554403
MIRTLAFLSAFALAGCSVVDDAVPLAQGESGQSAHAEALYAENCAVCHDGGVAGAPTREALAALSPAAIIEALDTGVMREQGASLDRIDRILLSQHVGNEAAGADVAIEYCEGDLTFAGAPKWNRWGANARNTRFQSNSDAGLDLVDIPKMELAWAFGFPGAQRARSQPAVTEEAIFTGSQSGRVYALDTETGCAWWTYEAGAEVRNAPLLSTGSDGNPDTLYFGDFDAIVHAVDARTGERRWSQSIQDHPDGTITGSLALHDGTLFVPMSSTEIVSAYLDDYACCTFRGGVIALDAQNGATQWRWHTVDVPRKVGESSVGTDVIAPSGAPVWSTPTIDAERGLLYVGTGENYSSPANDLSDAIVALDLTTGQRRWAFQSTPNDAWNAACGRDPKPNCPSQDGPDFDFGAPPMLVDLAGGGQILLAGQKSGEIFGLDPDNSGKLLWRRRVGMGGFNGGIHWGMASDGATLWVGIADTPGNKFAKGPPRPGIHAFNPRTGAPLWSRIEEPTCDEVAYKCMTALSAPLSAIPGAVFAGAHNGRLLAYSSEDGSVLWSDETNREFETVNGVQAKGGTIDSSGVVIAGGLVIVNSGYDKFGEIPGNVLLVYRRRGS